MKNFLAVLTISFILTTVLTWPFITKLWVHYSDYGDYPLVGWILWYSQDAVFSGKIFNQTEYFNSNQFYPFPYTLAYSEHLLVPSMIFAPIFLLSHHLIFSVNFFMFLTFILSLVTSYYSLNFFIKKPAASLIGSMVFAFNPLVFAQFGHMQLMHRYFLPLIFLFGYKYIQKPDWKNTALFGLVFSLNCMSGIYFQTFGIISIFIFFFPFIVQKIIAKKKAYFIQILKTAYIFIPFILMLFYINYPYLQFSTLEEVTRSISENAFYSARLIDWTSTLPENVVHQSYFYKTISFRNPKDPAGSLNLSEHTLSPNVVPFILFILGAYLAFAKLEKSENLLMKSSFLILALSLFVFTFGPFFYGWNGSDKSLFTLPYYYLYKHIIFFQGTRVPTRFQFVFYVPFALFVSFGVVFLLNKFKKFEKLIIPVLVLLIVVENYQLMPYDATSNAFNLISKADKNFINILKNKTTLHFPIFEDPPQNSSYLILNSFTNEKIFNGYSGFVPADWIALAHKFIKLDKESFEALSALDFDYVVIHKKYLTPGYMKIVDDQKELLSKLKTYEDDQYLIADVKRFEGKAQLCPRTTLKVSTGSFSYHVMGIDGLWYQSIPQVTIQNPSNDCFIENKYSKRYMQVKMLWDGKNIEKTVKLPPLIYPLQSISFK